MINAIRQFIATGKEIKYNRVPLNREVLRQELRTVEAEARAELLKQKPIINTHNDGSIIANLNVQGANNRTPIETPVETLAAGGGIITNIIDTLNKIPPIELDSI